MTHIKVQYSDTPVKVAVRTNMQGGHVITNGMSALASRIIINMTPEQKLRYDFYQGQLNRVRKEY